MLAHLAILPQLRIGSRAIPPQALLLSAAFMFCAVVSAVCVGFGRLGGGSLSELRRRLIDGTAGGMILLAAGSWRWRIGSGNGCPVRYACRTPTLTGTTLG